MASLPHLAAESCSVASPSEPLVGAALPGVEFWILLEHYGPWAPKAIDSPELGEPARKAIARALEELPGARFQLIRRPDRARGQSRRLFLGRSLAPQGWMRSLDLESSESLGDLDLAAILRSGEHPEAVTLSSSLFLVCAHGRRDRCCGLLGIPLFRAMLAESADRADVWQSSHVGGHRFAPNVQVLPAGLIYGRVIPERSGEFLDAHRQGRLFDLAHLRGRMLFEQPVQAAEIFLRKTGSLSSAEAPTLLEHSEGEGGVHLVRFAFGGENLSIRVRRAPSSLPPRPMGCGDAPTPVKVWESVPDASG